MKVSMKLLVAIIAMAVTAVEAARKKVYQPVLTAEQTKATVLGADIEETCLDAGFVKAGSDELCAVIGGSGLAYKNLKDPNGVIAKVCCDQGNFATTPAGRDMHCK